jgi:hypothetical protein
MAAREVIHFPFGEQLASCPLSPTRIPPDPAESPRELNIRLVLGPSGRVSETLVSPCNAARTPVFWSAAVHADYRQGDWRGDPTGNRESIKGVCLHQQARQIIPYRIETFPWASRESKSAG